MHPIGTVVLIQATINQNNLTDDDGLLCYRSTFPTSGEQWFGEGDIFAVVSEPVCAEQAPFVPTGFKPGDEVLWVGHEILGVGKIEASFCKLGEPVYFNIRFKDGLRHDFEPSELVFAHGLCVEQAVEPMRLPHLKFKSGDRVKHSRLGKGVVLEIGTDPDWPYAVLFHNPTGAVMCPEGKLTLVEPECEPKFKLDDNVVCDQYPGEIGFITAIDWFPIVYTVTYQWKSKVARVTDPKMLHKVTIN
jgi:hypothetical protein